MAKYLSKEEELHLGGLIQNMLKAKVGLEAAEEIFINGETNPVNIAELTKTCRSQRRTRLQPRSRFQIALPRRS
jgi:hypothetical protein